MTVILEEDLEDSNLNFTQNLAASSASKMLGTKKPNKISFNKSQLVKEAQDSYSKDQ